MDFNLLNNNSIVLTGVQYVEESPLGFFEFDNISDKKNVFENKVTGFTARGKVVVNNTGFKGTVDSSGHKIAEEKYIITRAKSRPVLIFQNIEFSKKFHDNVFIVPIQTLRKPIESNYTDKTLYNDDLKQYQDILDKSEETYNYYYIPIKDASGKSLYDRMLILNDARFVHKSTLFGQVMDSEISKADLREIGIRLSKMMDINELEKCSTCLFNSNKTDESSIDCTVEIIKNTSNS